MIDFTYDNESIVALRDTDGRCWSREQYPHIAICYKDGKYVINTSMALGSVIVTQLTVPYLINLSVNTREVFNTANLHNDIASFNTAKQAFGSYVMQGYLTEPQLTLVARLIVLVHRRADLLDKLIAGDFQCPLAIETLVRKFAYTFYGISNFVPWTDFTKLPLGSISEHSSEIINKWMEAHRL